MTTQLKTPPGPRGTWLLGNLAEFRKDHLAFYTRCSREFGDVVQYRFGPIRITQVNHPDLIEEVLVHQSRNFHKGFGHQLIKPIVGEGLLTSEGAFWLRQRRMAQPAFKRERINAYAPAMVACTAERLDRWQPGQVIELYQEMMALTLDIAARTLFGSDMLGLTERLSTAFNTVQETFVTRFHALFNLPLWVPTPGNLRLRHAIRELDTVIFRLIEHARTNYQDRDDLLARMMQARDEDGSQMTDRQLRDELITFVLAAHETTALTLTWTLYLLAQNPEADARLGAEIQAVLGDRPATSADMAQLPYTENVIREAMRLYPPAYGFGRKAVAATELGGYPIPAGSMVFVVPWVTHRDARYFPEPEAFRPERWTPAFREQLPRFAYFPFGGGPRVCIGAAFAMLEAVLVLATLRQRFRFILEPGQTITPTPAITLRPLPGVSVRLEEFKQPPIPPFQAPLS